MENPVLQIHPSDDLVVALRRLEPGRTVQVGERTVTIRRTVPRKHQVATRDLSPGETITYYGITVARAREPIPEGTPLTPENVSHATAAYRHGGAAPQWNAPDISAYEARTFLGYPRAGGRVGTANVWLVVPLVFCENRNVDVLRQAFLDEIGYGQAGRYRDQVRSLVRLYREGRSPEEIRSALKETKKAAGRPEPLFPNVDGLRFLTHGLGCGGTTDDAKTFAGLLASYIAHPNTAGATVLSLGCQKTQIKMLQEELERLSPGHDRPVFWLEQQEYGTEEALLRTAVGETFAGLMEADKSRRVPSPIGKLCLGVECGGSDGFSGISANPTIGKASDLLIALGGSVILSEFPELCGVEQEIINRCRNRDDARRFTDLMEAYQKRAAAVGASFKENPSAGNIRDGLVTDAIKSAGAARKGGTSPVVDVQDYPGWVTQAGLNLLCTPGSDVESTTGLAGAGATILCFSTGLGTPTGNPVSPVLKISTNSDLAERMPDIIDYDAGPIVTGAKSLEEAGRELFDLCLRVAGGETRCKADLLGQADFMPWKRGVSL